MFSCSPLPLKKIKEALKSNCSIKLAAKNEWFLYEYSTAKSPINIPILSIDRNFCMQKLTAPLRDPCLGWQNIMCIPVVNRLIRLIKERPYVSSKQYTIVIPGYTSPRGCSARNLISDFTYQRADWCWLSSVWHLTEITMNANQKGPPAEGPKYQDLAIFNFYEFIQIGYGYIDYFFICIKDLYIKKNQYMREKNPELSVKIKNRQGLVP